MSIHVWNRFGNKATMKICNKNAKILRLRAPHFQNVAISRLSITCAIVLLLNFGPSVTASRIPTTFQPQEQYEEISSYVIEDDISTITPEDEGLTEIVEFREETTGETSTMASTSQSIQEGSSQSTTTTPTTKEANSTPVTFSTTSTVTSIGQLRHDQDETEDEENPIDIDGRRYSDVFATCDGKRMKVHGEFLRRFKGRIYTYGYPDEPECGVFAHENPKRNLTFVLPLGRCGVQMIPSLDPEVDSPKRHEVTLYVQYSSFLQQVVDDKISVSCVEVENTYDDDSFQNSQDEVGSSRTGRRMGNRRHFVGAKGTPGTKISSRIAESWMEILAGKDPSPKSRKSQPVAVGEDVTLVISTKVMRGYDARIVNCSANDGSKLGILDGYRSQQILDSAGCSVDTSLVPNFRRRRLPIQSRNRLITLHFATFQAFKFPERDHLHIKCAVAYCQGPCPHEACDTGINHFGSWREKYGRIADALIDTSEIVNSIEVTAPELENIGAGGGYHFERHQSGRPVSASVTSSAGGYATDMSSRQNDWRRRNPKAHGHHSLPPPPNGKEVGGLGKSQGFSTSGSVCVSPGSIVLALIILGVILVISASATLWFALKRSESKKYRQTIKHTPFHHGPQPYYRFSHCSDYYGSLASAHYPKAGF